MKVTVVGKKSFTNKNGKEMYVVNALYTRDNTIGFECLSGFTNKENYDKIEPDLKKELDMAVFFDKGYTNIYYKKGE